MIEKKCVKCGKSFLVFPCRGDVAKYCSVACSARSDWRHSKEARGKTRAFHLGRKRSPETCERIRISKLGNQYSRGCKRSDEWKGKLRAANLGKHMSDEANGKNRLAHIGLHASEETKKKMSLAQKGRPRTAEWLAKLSGQNCYCWMGGKSFEPYSPEFNRQMKRKIRERDNFTCQMPGCGVLEGGEKLAVHHIDYDKKKQFARQSHSSLPPLPQ